MIKSLLARNNHPGQYFSEINRTSKPYYNITTSFTKRGDRKGYNFSAKQLGSFYPKKLWK